jgi:probable F420-dependent oxidoreductase
MATIKVGVQLHPQHTSFEDLRRAWLELDEMGIDALFTWDHFFPLYGDPKGSHWEGWTTVAALGPQTKQAQVGHLVMAMSYRNPALLSAMAKTLDHATGGRLILGLGAGWAKRDYDEYGYEFGTAGDRLRNLERGLEVIKERWAKDPPKPVRGAIPILIGGGGEKVTLRIAAQHADIWNGFGAPEAWGRKNGVLDEWCAKVGRDPSAIQRSPSINLGDLDTLDDYVAAGANFIIVRLASPWDTKPYRQLVDWRDRQRR